jgi:diguanylate cyclase (GGDEF)-like protein/putative nucleotidyltransferase with HDIG domain
MSNNPLSELAKLALGSTQNEGTTDALPKALGLIRSQTGAIAALSFFADADGKLTGAGVGDDPARYPESALTYLQQRLVQLRVPMSFNVDGDQIVFLTRAATKQRRDYMAWLIPVADSWTELLILRGSWPPSATERMIEQVDAMMPALTLVLERYVGAGRAQRLERQLSSITGAVDVLGRSAELIGSIAAAYPSSKGFPDDQVPVLRDLAFNAGSALQELRANRDAIEAHLRLQEYTSRLERTVEIERQNATTDALTGLLNHRGGLQALKSAFDAATNDDTAVSLLVGDIDSFKLFNDTYGHVAGDEVLKLVARNCSAVVGSLGTACRYGGDEFLLILPNMEKRDASKLARDIMELLGDVEFRTDNNQSVPIRMSVGVATYPDDTSSPSNLVATADAAMYEAKKRLEGAKKSSLSSREDTTFGVLESLVLAVDAKDRYTKDHCDLVAEYAVKLAQRLNLSDESVRALRVAGLLHDVGKLAVPDEILKKPAPLTEEEYEIMKRHVRIGEVLIREVPQLKDVIQAVSCHHERYDGSGYPRGLAGEGIPLLGRIIAVADAYSAMCLDRPYRKAMALDAAVAEFVSGAGIQFDPDIARAFVDMLLEEQLQRQFAA